MDQKHLNILARTPLFSGIERDKLDGVLHCLLPVIKKYPKGEIIALLGQPLYGIGLLLSGSVHIVRESVSGDRIIMAQLQRGQLFGEVVAYSHDPRWPVTVIAQADCEVMFLPTIKLTSPCCNACQWHRQLIFNMLQILSEKALALNKKIGYLTLKSMRSKISAYLLDQHQRSGQLHFDIPISRNGMAEMLNVSRPSMSREMGRMRQEGLIDFHLSHIEIKDLDTLRQFAEQAF